MSSEKKAVYIVAGPTAGGKSALALALAERQDGIVINADSVQIYDGLPCLTAQPSEEEKSHAPHRLYGLLPPAESCTAARWAALALAEIRAALDAGKTPILAGGTGFYIEALADGLSPVPDVPGDIRAKTRDIFAQKGLQDFAAALAARDPDIAGRIDMNNPQRLMRAFEVLEATGKSLAAWQDLPREGGLKARADLDVVTILLLPPRDVLYARCNARFEKMLEAGALEEVRDLAAAIESGDVPEDAPLTRALGFDELRLFLDGKLSREEAVSQAQQKTRNYAKRQMTWFKNRMPDAVTVDNASEDTIARLLP
ncbi:MAG: tRNA (adenosine(37)-N6)-dimethylallyltransferase MiaA [Micavibrio sp.]|nr:MAG: tRNA (adenosine(37)-N6)-dimethylallyltransferase MiaA [Micavibrio sp.]